MLKPETDFELHTCRVPNQRDAVFRIACILFCSTVAACSFPSVSSAQDANRVKIGSNYVSANGCHDTTQTFTAVIPHADRLNKNYHGVLDGIEVVETGEGAGHRYENFMFISNGNAVSSRLYARGGRSLARASVARFLDRHLVCRSSRRFREHRYLCSL